LNPRILHIINPVKVSEQSDLFFAQPITFESLKNAKNYSKSVAAKKKQTSFNQKTLLQKFALKSRAEAVRQSR
jgi:hypothetical protein